jgi:hypothetical protein
VAKQEDQAMTWQNSYGTNLAGQEAVDSLDLVAIQMERKWGADRLRLLVSEELRAKFDRQRKLTNDAIMAGDLAALQRETKRMITAWRALDTAADQDPANRLPATVWEVPLEDGSVAQLVRETEMAGLQAARERAAGRQVAVYTLEEVGRLLSKFPTLYAAKHVFPGATVTCIRQSVTDPLNNAPEAA